MMRGVGIWSCAVWLVLTACSSSSGDDSSAKGGDGASDNSGGTSARGGSSSSSGGSHAQGGSTSSNGGGSTAQGGSGNDTSTNGGNSAAGSSNPTAGSGPVNAALPVIGGCNVFTADDAWNTSVADQTVDDAWTTKLQALVGKVNIHPDYGDATIGIPINVVPDTQTKVSPDFDEAEESDKGPYAFPDPATAKIEGGTPTNCDGDCHLLSVQQGSCILYEAGNCSYGGGKWSCYSGAIFDLKKNSYGQRPIGWTSADAAGLSITAGLVRYDEAAAGAIHHAIRFTVPCTLDKYVNPASHEAVPSTPPGCAGNANAVPMGLRVRLDSDFAIPAGASTVAKAVITAMQTYGMILADNGSSFYFQGESTDMWNDDGDIEPLKKIPASAFKVVQVPPLMP